MANNELKPNYSSSEDEEEEEEASGSEDEHTSGSESDEASDSPSDDKQKSNSDTESDSPPKHSTVADPNIKPIRSIPMQQEQSTPESELAQKSGSGSKFGSETGLSTAPARSKRPATEDEKDVKRARSNTTTDDDTKKQLFQRLWSEDDEIVILKGMIDYKAVSGENLIADMGAFHEFIKKSLHVDVSRAQLVDKIRRLKKKYVNNVSREKDGKDRSFSKSHEQRGYELSKLVWGGAGGGGNSGIESRKNKSQKNGDVAGASGYGVDDKEVEVVEGEKNMDISRFVRYGGRDESPVLLEEIVKGGMELVEGAKRVELEERWRSLKKEELEIYLKKMDLVKEQGLMVLEAVNSSGN